MMPLRTPRISHRNPQVANCSQDIVQRLADVKALSTQFRAVSVVRTRLTLRDVSLYVQKDTQDLPLPETAECLAANALLRICGLRFDVCEKQNTEYMSPSGRAPFVKCGSDIVSEMEPIARYLCGRGVAACSRLDSADGPRLRALCSLLQSSLSAAELRVCWLHDATRRSLTDPRVSSGYPWPLCRFVAFQKRRRAIHWLRAVDGAKGGATFSLEQLYDQDDSS
ncbi:metaxin-2-like [Schistocerca serialis cubense]|uniref:metaxin-2-like n=1 Tax=Schistocerca serialis cubense TaxID=2023355 RepID=UPI00214F221B|nr:metaxin-2-like [Schistocerca serialis cubense]